MTTGSHTNSIRTETCEKPPSYDEAVGTLSYAPPSPPYYDVRTPPPTLPESSGTAYRSNGISFAPQSFAYTVPCAPQGNTFGQSYSIQSMNFSNSTRPPIQFLPPNPPRRKQQDSCSIS